MQNLLLLESGTTVEAHFNNSIKNNFKKIDFHFASFSSKVINYKGMLLASQVKDFYPDLKTVLINQLLLLFIKDFQLQYRFPSWELAQIFRMIAQNNKITPSGEDLNWMKE